MVLALVEKSACYLDLVGGCALEVDGVEGLDYMVSIERLNSLHQFIIIHY
jgi:hypothetical protein